MKRRNYPILGYKLALQSYGHPHVLLSDVTHLVWLHVIQLVHVLFYLTTTQIELFEYMDKRGVCECASQILLHEYSWSISLFCLIMHQSTVSATSLIWPMHHASFTRDWTYVFYWAVLRNLSTVPTRYPGWYTLHLLHRIMILFLWPKSVKAELHFQTTIPFLLRRFTLN
jgi:hypothetical protein